HTALNRVVVAPRNANFPSLNSRVNGSPAGGAFAKSRMNEAGRRTRRGQTPVAGTSTVAPGLSISKSLPEKLRTSSVVLRDFAGNSLDSFLKAVCRGPDETVNFPGTSVLIGFGPSG